MTMHTLELEIDGHVGRLVLDRPDKLNSFTIEMWRELRELGQGLVADPGDLRALIVIGAGRAFSSGIDTSVFAGGDQDSIAGGPDAGTRHANPMVDGIMRTQEAFSWLEDAPFATIAAARGFALGAGCRSRWRATSASSPVGSASGCSSTSTGSSRTSAERSGCRASWARARRRS